MGQGEDDVEVLHGQQFGHSGFEPLGPFSALTLRAMPVPAGAVNDAGMLAMIADFDLGAELGGAAGGNSPHHAELLAGQPVCLAVGAAMESKDVGQLESGARPGGAHWLALARGWRTSESSGLDVAAARCAPTRI